MSIGSVGGGNYFSDLNSKLATRGPDAAALESARAAGGGKAEQAKSAKADKGVSDHHHVGEGLHLSKKAKAELDQEMADSGQAQEQAEMLGLTQDLNTSEDGQVSERTARNSDRHTHLGEDEDVRVVANSQAQTESDKKDAERLQILDEDDGGRLNGDVPQANLDAASRVFSAQAGQGIKKVAELKPVPEVHEAGPIETKIVGLESSPMDIRDVGNDPRFAPMQLELPESTHEMAKEMAARQLASGELDEAMIR